jgi:TatA/E family protein of Tat protein translocase
VFGIGGNELLIIGVFALILFGPDKIPEIARTVGKAWQMFKRAQDDMEHIIRTEIYSTEKPGDPRGGAAPTTSAAPVEPIAVAPANAAAGIWAAADEDDEEDEE